MTIFAVPGRFLSRDLNCNSLARTKDESKNDAIRRKRAGKAAQEASKLLPQPQHL
jgi:hypothetical protein